MLRHPQRRHLPRPVEGLEARLCLAAPTPLAGSPFPLPSTGPWTGTPFVASPIFADLAGDGTQELIASVAGGRLVAYKYNTDGALSTFQVYSTGADATTGANIKSTPVVVTQANGRKAIFAALGRDEGNPGSIEDGRLFGWDALTGAILPGWPQDTGHVVQNGNQAGVTGPLAAGDLDGDGVPEIVVTSFSTFVSAYKLDGSLLWRFQNGDTAEGGAVIGDIDHDGKNEVVYATGISPAFAPNDNIAFPAGGYITILNDDGTLRRRIRTDEVYFSSPILVDLLGNGELDIVDAPGPHFNDPQFNGNVAAAKAAGNRVYAYDPRGNLLPGWPYVKSADDNSPHQNFAQLAAADLLGDGRTEIITVDRTGLVHVIQPDGTPLPGWAGGRAISPVAQADVFGGAIVADALGDGHPDIIVGQGAFLSAFDRFGNLVFRNVTPVSPGGNANVPDSILSAAAVGNLGGASGLVLASMSNLAATANRPAALDLFRLSPSTLANPWPLQRQTADGKAIATNVQFDAIFTSVSFLALLGRAPTAGESAAYSNGLRQNLFDDLALARHLALSPEGTAHLGSSAADAGALAAKLGPIDRLFGIPAVPAESLASALFELRRGKSYPEIAASNLVALGNYAITSAVGSYVRSLYRDLLGRQATGPEVAVAVTQLDTGGASTVGLAQYLLNSIEGRNDYINRSFLNLLGRPATPQELSGLQLYARREDVLVYIATTAEYYARAGGTDAGLAASAFRDIQQIGPLPQSFIDYYVNRLRTGGPTTQTVIVRRRRVKVVVPVTYTRATFAQEVTSGASYDNDVALQALFKYAPDISLGVLRTGGLALNAPGQPLNPSPGAVSMYAHALAVGYRQEDVITALVTTNAYIHGSSYDQGFYIGRSYRV